MNYIDIGNKNSPCIICLHGLGATKDYWSDQFELSDTYRLIIPDLQINDLEQITLNNIALEVIDLIKYLNIESTYIIGHSLGVSIALEIERIRSDLVRGLILANGTAYIPISIANHVREKSEKIFIRDRNELTEYIVDNSLYDKSLINKVKEKFYLSDAYLDYITLAAGHNFVPILLRCNKPVLLIAGNHDRIVPLFNQIIMHWLCSKSDIVTFESGHLSNIECKNEFNHVIRDFLELNT